MPEERHFAPLRILYLFIKHFVNPFVSFFVGLSSSFSTSTYFVLFEVTFLFKFLVYYQNLSLLQKQQYQL